MQLTPSGDSQLPRVPVDNDISRVIDKFGIGERVGEVILHRPEALLDIPASDPHYGVAILVGAALGDRKVQQQFAGVRLSTVVTLCMEMDPAEALIVSMLGECHAIPPERTPRVFEAVLSDAIQRHKLHLLFERGGDGDFHRSITPRGYNSRTGQVYPEEMAKWRADFRAMAPERQILAATIIWLYQCGSDSTWLRRVPCTWDAVDAIGVMRSTGSLLAWLHLM